MVWKNEQFNLAKYKKGHEEKSWVLRNTDEIRLILED
jgi:hypothetical protein